jgi:hypothetical protein
MVKLDDFSVLIDSFGNHSGKEFGQEIFLEILKPKSFRIQNIHLLRKPFRKSKDDGKVGMFFGSYGL